MVNSPEKDELPLAARKELTDIKERLFSIREKLTLIGAVVVFFGVASFLHSCHLRKTADVDAISDRVIEKLRDQGFLKEGVRP